MKTEKELTKKEFITLTNQEILRKKQEQINKEIREHIFDKLNWNEKKYFVDLCSERDYMDSFLRFSFSKIENRLNKLEKVRPKSQELNNKGKGK